MERFRIEVGLALNRVKPGNMWEAMPTSPRLTGRSIGRIQIFDTHSTIDLPQGMPEMSSMLWGRLRV